MIWAVVGIAILLALAFIAWVLSQLPPGGIEIAGSVQWDDTETGVSEDSMEVEIAASFPPGTTWDEIPAFMRPRLDPQQGMGNNEVLTRDGRDS